MSATSDKSFIFQVLIIEDEPTWYEPMAAFLEDFADKKMLELVITLAKNCVEARSYLADGVFHVVAIDLLLPDQIDEPITSSGIALAEFISTQAPLTWAHFFSGHAEKKGLELFNEVIAGKHLPAILEKACSDNEEGRYTQKQWAERIVAALLPRSKALSLDIVKKRPELQNNLGECSDLGESMDFAFNAARYHLPPGLALSCTYVHQWAENGEAHKLTAFKQVLDLAEYVQHWLWIQAMAWLTAMSQTDKLAWLSQGNAEKSPTRFTMQESFKMMIEHIAQSPQADLASLWLAHLHFQPDAGTMSIIEALNFTRELRNKHSHNDEPNPPPIISNKEPPWQQLVIPLRVLMDAAAFFAAYPIVHGPDHAADGRWRFTVLQGTDKLPLIKEWSLAAGVVGEGKPFSKPPRPDNDHLYALWPCAEGKLGLLKLWPFVEYRLPDSKGSHFDISLFCGLASRKKQQLWERSAISNGTNRNDKPDERRMNRLFELGLK